MEQDIKKAENVEKLFFKLYNAGTEKELSEILDEYSTIFQAVENWRPLGGNDNNYGVIENQQSSPIASLIEKLTNSIDAILMKECLESDLDPKSKEAPRTIEEAKERFFPNHKVDWNLAVFKRKQAEEIQVVADGTPRDTSVIIYDNGEGQHPEDFENTFLSLLRGNKNEIHFVQGKYNMGGSGAIVFCGHNGYQLIGSKRYDNSGNFGFTLIRQHPLSKEEEKIKKNTWYEYFVIDDQVPAFPISELNLGLHNRAFKTGTVIKMYSYQFPSGYFGFAQDLNQSINEYLFEPALPILTVDKKERYPNNKVLELDLYGLKRRLEESQEYIDEDGKFSEEYNDALFGSMKVNCYVFKAKIKKWDVKKTKEQIQRRFFKNNMAVLFSMNGQVHGHYTSEFITRSLKMSILKNHLLIHVDCTKMNYNFRKELFMASRDRLKDGRETRELRKFLASKLATSQGQLAAIAKRRKDSISVSGESTKELLKDFTKNMPMSDELRELLGNAFKLDNEKKRKSVSANGKKNKGEQKERNFSPKRYPTYLRFQSGNKGDISATKIPLGGERTIKFETDVEDEYFDRVDDPGELEIALLKYESNDTEGGNGPGKPNKIEDVLNVVKSSPNKGTIRVVLAPKENVNVGDAVQIKISLKDQWNTQDQVFYVKIGQPQKSKTAPKENESVDTPLGLPTPILVYKENNYENAITWEKFEDSVGETMNYYTVMHPMAEGDALERIYINMDSNVLKSFKSKQSNISAEQLELADRKYISSVYFHTLFLYTITKKRSYNLSREEEGKEKEVDIGEYVKDVFDSIYSDFILNFGTIDLMAAISV